MFFSPEHLWNLLRTLRLQEEAGHVLQVRRFAARVRHVPPVPSRAGQRRRWQGHSLRLRPRQGRLQDVGAEVGLLSAPNFDMPVTGIYFLIPMSENMPVTGAS